MDNRINSTIDGTKVMLQAASKTYEPVIYTGAGHGFMRAGEVPDAKEADRKARGDAWKRWKSLMERLS